MVAKDCKVIDQIPTYYSIGHLCIPGGNSKKPTGKYVVALTTRSRRTAISRPVRSSRSRHSSIDITGDEDEASARLPDDRRAALRAGGPGRIDQAESDRSSSSSRTTASVVSRTSGSRCASRKGNEVHVNMTSIRSHFAPDNIEGVKVGDTVLLARDRTSSRIGTFRTASPSWADNDRRAADDAGRDRAPLTWEPKYAGVYPFYCTDFCSALHQEMQGYVRVRPAGRAVDPLGTQQQLAGGIGPPAPQAGRRCQPAGARALFLRGLTAMLSIVRLLLASGRPALWPCVTPLWGVASGRRSTPRGSASGSGSTPSRGSRNTTSTTSTASTTTSG